MATSAYGRHIVNACGESVMFQSKVYKENMRVVSFGKLTGKNGCCRRTL